MSGALRHKHDHTGSEDKRGAELDADGDQPGSFGLTSPSPANEVGAISNPYKTRVSRVNAAIVGDTYSKIP